MENMEGVLRKHVIKFHHNQNICETCGRVFNDPRLFDVHVKSAHSDVRDHFCDRCGKVRCIFDFFFDHESSSRGPT